MRCGRTDDGPLERHRGHSCKGAHPGRSVREFHVRIPTKPSTLFRTELSTRSAPSPAVGDCNLKNPPSGHREAQIDPFDFKHHDLSESKVAGHDEVAACPHDSPPGHIGRTLLDRLSDRLARPRLPQRLCDIAIRGDPFRAGSDSHETRQPPGNRSVSLELPPCRGQRFFGRIG